MIYFTLSTSFKELKDIMTWLRTFPGGSATQLKRIQEIHMALGTSCERLMYVKFKPCIHWVVHSSIGWYITPRGYSSASPLLPLKYSMK